MSHPSSALIRVVLSQKELQIEPGQRGELLVTIQNLSEIVDQYAIEMDGLDPSWYTIPIPEVSLFPQDQERVRISLHPPSGPQAQAGTYDFTVSVASRENPTEETAVSATLDVLATPTLDVELSPQKASSRRDGAFQVKLANPSNVDLTIDLFAADPEGACIYQFQSQRVSLGAGQSREVSLTVTPKTRPHHGEVRHYDFTVRAVPTMAPAQARTVTGSLEHRSTLPKWALPAGIVAILLLFCGSATFAGYVFLGDDVRELMARLRGGRPTATEVVFDSPLPEVQATADDLAAEKIVSPTTSTPTNTPTTGPTPTPSPTNVPTDVPTQSPTLTPAPSPTPTHTPTPAPTDTPTMTPTPCPLVPASAFTVAWGEVRDRVGCPARPEIWIWAAEEPFEGGYMIWRGDTQRIYALYDDGTWQDFADTWHEGDPEYTCPEVGPTDSPPTPKRGFGKVWCLNSHVRDKLGWALEKEQGTERWVQDFDRGKMVHIYGVGTVALYDDGTWSSF